MEYNLITQDHNFELYFLLAHDDKRRVPAVGDSFFICFAPTMEKCTLTRNEIYDLVWSHSMVALSKRFVISDNGLRKACKLMNIPLPNNGYWVKLKFGKKVNVKSLPEDLQCDQQVELEIRKEGEEFSHDPVKKLAKEIKVDTSNPLSPENPLIIIARKRLKDRDARSYNHPRMVESNRDELDIRVTPKNIERALRFMDVLIKTLRRRHHDIKFRSGETYAVVKGDDIKIKFHELSKRVVANDRSWGYTELQPTGILCLKTGSFTPREWKDSVTNPAKRVEHLIPEAIAWMEMEADRWNALRAEHQRENEAAEKVRQAEKDLLERKRLELEAFEQLLGDSQRWSKVRVLRDYIDEAERRGAASEWVSWAREKADWYDPFVGTVDPFLGKYTVKN